MTDIDIDIGVLFATDRMDGKAMLDYARRLEAVGIDSVWLAELMGREPFATAGAVLASTSSLRVGTAIANVYARDATAAACASATLAELSGGRFELGLGVSNRALNEARGHAWDPPVERLRAYVTDIRSIEPAVPEPRSFPIHVAAHGPKMVAQAAEVADGLFTYLMTPEHTARTRATVGPDPAVTPMTMCLLCPDPEEARRLARRAIGYYVGLDYYHRAWRTLGFTDEDFAEGGSDRLIDAVVAWGSIDDIRRRVEAQADAGATRLVVIPLNPAGGRAPDWGLLEQLGSTDSGAGGTEPRPR